MINFGEQIKETISALSKSLDEELYAKTQDELEEYWYYQWDDNRDVNWNLYEFFDNLKSYSSTARRWETHHNGSCCVVERVRDNYTLPKIKVFAEIVREKINAS